MWSRIPRSWIPSYSRRVAFQTFRQPYLSRLSRSCKPPALLIVICVRRARCSLGRASSENSRQTRLSVLALSTRGHSKCFDREISTSRSTALGQNPTTGNVLQYESTGRLVQNQVVINFRGQVSEKISFFGNYSMGFAKSDTEGPGSLPANSNDLRSEYGNSGLDIRHRFTAGGSVRGPFGFELAPFVTYRSGVPFNITTGKDGNADTLFNDRPSFAMPGEAGVVVTPFGSFDPTPEPGDIVIPRNFGRGPELLQANLQIAKTFSIGAKKAASKDDDEGGKYNLGLSAQIRNLFNRNNLGTPVGNLSSSFFGNSLSTSSGSSAVGNRRIRFELTFSF